VCTRFVAGVFAAVSILVSSGCSGGILGRQYEYEEDLRLAIDGSATLVVNASLPALAALRGLPVSTDPSARFDSDQIRTLFDTPVTRVTRVSRPWRRKGRRFVQVRMEVSDVRRLGEAPPFSWSRYEFGEQNGHHVFRQTVGASAMKPGSLGNYGWDGTEIVAFRLHLPSRILHHLADRLDGQPVSVLVEMESQSILHRTLWLFAGAFAAAVLVLALLIWWTMSRGKNEDVAAT
jgi:hypothetical protein